MGNFTSSNNNNNQICEDSYQNFIDKNVYHKGNIQIYQFGQVPLFKNDITNQEYFRYQYEFIVPSTIEKQQNVLSVLKKINNDCPNLIHIWKIAQKQSFSNCNGKSKVFVYFQYLSTTLKDLIENRKASFPQNEGNLFYAKSLILCFLLLNTQTINKVIMGISHRNLFTIIKTLCISIFSIKKIRYKIFDPIYFNPIKSGYYRAQNEKVFCAPQILTNLNQKRTFPLYNHYICDTFSIGLVILYCMTLINPVLAYKNAKKEIDYYYIESLIRIGLKQGYSEELIKCLRECLLVKNRPTVSQILQNYEFLNSIQIINEDLKYSLSKKY